MPDTRGLLLTIGAEATEKPGRMVALAGSHATQLLAILLVSALLFLRTRIFFFYNI